MKNLGLFAVSLGVLLTALPVSAQHRVGFLGGLNTARISEDPPPEDYTLSGRKGFTVGTFYEPSLGQYAAIRLESFYVQKGGGIADTFYDEYYDILIDFEGLLELNYVETTSLLCVLPGKGTVRPYFLAGPAVSYLISAQAFATASVYGYSETDSKDVTESVSDIDIGFIFGGGIRFDYFFVEARYAMGLNDISPNDDVENLNRGFQLNAGVSVPIGQ